MNQISSSKEIRTEYPVGEIWSYLSLYRNEEYSKRKIIQNSGEIDAGKYKKDIEKQCRQIRYSIIQGKEYFDAAETATIATKPLLLYYGAVSLTQALILLKRDGSYSIDALRNRNRHNHHGLEMVKEYQKNHSSLDEFLNAIRCKIFTTKSAEPWGHFALLYDSLVPDVSLVKGTIEFDGSSIKGFISQPVNNIDKRSIDFFKGRQIAFGKLMSYLPDMNRYLKAMNIETHTFLGSISLHSRKEIGIRSSGKIIQQNTRHQYGYTISELEEPAVKKWFIDEYKSGGFDFKVVDENTIMAFREYVSKLGEQEETVYFPEVVSTIADNIFFIHKTDEYVQESASMFIMIFMLGMLCRYFPDIWMERIGNLGGFAEIIGYFLGLFTRKYPNLILNQLEMCKYTFA